MDTSRLWDLMGKRFYGELSPEEEEELNLLLRGNPDAQFLMETMASCWKPSDPRTLPQEDIADEFYARHIKRLAQAGFDMTPGAEFLPPSAQPDPVYPWDRPKGRGSSHRSRALALFLALATGSGILWFLFRPHSGSQAPLPARGGMSVVSTRNGSRTEITLPDSTQVWLNGGTRLTYVNNFSNRPVREVYLSGEAFFDVVHNKRKPFIIHTQKMDIEDLGTAFDVKSYPGDRTFETTLLRGEVEVSFHSNPSRRVILKANEKMIVYNDQYRLDEIPSPAPKQALAGSRVPDSFRVTRIQLLTPDSLVPETSWLDNRIIFQSESFGDLALQMEHKYNVNIHFADDQLKGYHYTGIFVTETIGQALHALQMASPSESFRYTIEKQDIYIYPR